jgi:hypothetical protein
METGVVDEASTQGGDFSAIVTEATKAANKVGGKFLGGAFGFTHSQQG